MHRASTNKTIFVLANGVIESVHDITDKPNTAIQLLISTLDKVLDYTGKLIIPGEKFIPVLLFDILIC